MSGRRRWRGDAGLQMSRVSKRVVADLDALTRVTHTAKAVAQPSENLLPAVKLGIKDRTERYW